MRAHSGAAMWARGIAEEMRAAPRRQPDFRLRALLRAALRLLDLLQWSFPRSLSDISIGFANLRPDYTPGGGPQSDYGLRRNDEKI